MAQKKKETAKKKQATKVVKAAPKKVAPKKAQPEKKELKKSETKTNTIITEVKKTEVTKAKKQQVTTPPQQPVRPAAAPQPGGKKRLLISFDKLPEEVVDIIRNKYPYGYNHDLKEVKGIDNKKFFVLPIELQDVIYLVKVDLRKPFKIEEAEEDEEDIFTPEEGFGGEEEGFPGADIEPIEGEEEDDGAKKKKKKSEDDDDDI